FATVTTTGRAPARIGTRRSEKNGASRQPCVHSRKNSTYWTIVNSPPPLCVGIGDSTRWVNVLPQSAHHTPCAHGIGTDFLSGRCHKYYPTTILSPPSIASTKARVVVRCYKFN